MGQPAYAAAGEPVPDISLTRLLVCVNGGDLDLKGKELLAKVMQPGSIGFYAGKLVAQLLTTKAPYFCHERPFRPRASLRVCIHGLAL